MKKILLIIAVLIMLFGCISPTLNQATFSDLEEIQKEFGVTDFYSPNTIIMNDYINDLSELRVRSSLSLASVIDAEIYSSKAFYYYSLSNQVSRVISLNNCNEKSKLELKNYLELSIKNSEIAIQKINSLLFFDTIHLKVNQKEIMTEINLESQKNLIKLDEIC